MGQNIYLIALFCCAIVFFGLAVFAARRGASGSSKTRSWLSYLLLWPLVLDADKAKRNGQLLTKREWLGGGLIVLIIGCAILLR